MRFLRFGGGSGSVGVGGGGSGGGGGLGGGRGISRDDPPLTDTVNRRYSL